MDAKENQPGLGLWLQRLESSSGARLARCDLRVGDSFGDGADFAQLSHQIVWFEFWFMLGF